MGTKKPLSTRLLSVAKISANQRVRPLKRLALLGTPLIRRIGGQQIRQAAMLGGGSLPGPRPWAGETRKPAPCGFITPAWRPPASASRELSTEQGLPPPPVKRPPPPAGHPRADAQSDLGPSEKIFGISKLGH